MIFLLLLELHPTFLNHFRRVQQPFLKIEVHVHLHLFLYDAQDNKSILIELDEEGWKFTCDNYDINIDNGLYFGNKNLYSENQNIFITGISNKEIECMKLLSEYICDNDGKAMPQDKYKDLLD